jgi:hypothetical protein
MMQYTTKFLNPLSLSSMSTRVFLTLFAGGMLWLTACDQTFNDAPPPSQSFDDIEAYHEATALLPDTFTVDNAEPVRIVTDEEAELLLPACALALPDGTPLCDLTGEGPCVIKVELLAIFRKKDMVLNQMMTQTLEGALLESGGMVKVRATFNDTIPLIVKAGESFQVKLPKSNTLTDSTRMAFYLEDGEAVADTLWVFKGALFAQDAEDYIIEHNQFDEWMSIGYPHEATEPDTLLFVEAVEGYTLDEVTSQVYVSLEDFHSILKATYAEGRFAVELPKSLAVRAVGLHTDGTYLYYGSAVGETGADATLTIPLQPKTPPQVAQSLEELEE